ncbi:hypothetical protein EZS27_041244, partial [termite gut metagenome]
AATVCNNTVNNIISNFLIICAYSFNFQSLFLRDVLLAPIL